MSTPKRPSSDEMMKSIDEPRLESDAVYRFGFVAEVVGLTEHDQDALRKHQPTLQPHLSGIVESVYRKMFQYESMKRHFLPRHEGFSGTVPSDLSDLTLDHEQTRLRKHRLEEYFKKLCTADWDETFAVLLDVVGRMHTPAQGNTSLEVPLIQITALLGFINDLFLEAISKLDLSAQSQSDLQRAYTKLFWVQNSMLVRHWTA